MKVVFKRNILHIVAVTLVSAIVFAWQFIPLTATQNTLNRLEGIIYDAKLKYLPAQPKPVTNVQIVDIDERSLVEIGRMPWRRDYYANLIDKLTEAGALVIVFDVLLSEPQDNVASQVFSYLKNNSGKDSIEILKTFENQSFGAFDFDGQLGQSAFNSEVVFSNLFHMQENLQTGNLKTSPIVQLRPQGQAHVNRFYGYAFPIEKLTSNSSGVGFMNSVEDDDGFVRRAALVAEFDGELYPSLALEAFRVYSLADDIEPIWSLSDRDVFMEGVKIGNQRVATDNQGTILVPFRGPPRTYQYTPAADVLLNRIEDNRFEQSVIFVGTSATGLADLRVTPMSINYPGVEIHATVFDGLVEPQYIPHRPDYWQGAIALTLLIFAIVSILLFPHFGPLGTTICTVTLLLLVGAINRYLWTYHFIDLPMVSSITLLLLISTYFVASGFFMESSQRRQVKAIFDQYVPPAHIERLLNDPDSVSLDGEKKEISVMFSDIRNFTNISESMTADGLKKWLNQYFSPTTQIILEHDGTIDKYVGDMVMAFWGAPLEDPAHANKSITASFAMLDKLRELNVIFEKENKPLVSIGIGINTGEMNVGDMGSDFRRNYTVIGDAVNLGSRLEGLTKFYGLELLVSEFTMKQAGEYEFICVDKVKVKGKDEPVTIYTPIPPNSDPAFIDNAHQFSNAMHQYFEKHFEEAQNILRNIESNWPYQKLVELYMERTEHLAEDPPQGDWDGSFTHKTK